MLSDIIREIKIEKIKINRLKDKYDSSSDINPTIGHEDFESLILSINNQGQNDPIYIWRNAIVDGRARTEALKQLGVKFVYVRKLPHKMGIEEREEVAKMKETRRHLTPTQKACKAVLAYYNVSASVRKSKGLNQESYAKASGASKANLQNAIYIYKNNKQWFDLLLDGKKIEYKNNLTDSLRILVAHLKEEKSLQDKINNELDEELYMSDIVEEVYHNKNYVYNKVLMGIELGNKENAFKNPDAQQVSIQDVIKFLQHKLIDELNKED